MKRAFAVLGIALGLAVLPLAGAFLLIESGEVIVLRTAPEAGDRFLARLWVVDHQGRPWIGKMDPSEARWVEAVRAGPRLQLVRGGEASCREAVFVEEREEMRELYERFQEKYHVPLYGARFLGSVLGGGNPDPTTAAESAVLIRLEPCEGTGAPGSPS